MVSLHALPKYLSFGMSLALLNQLLLSHCHRRRDDEYNPCLLKVNFDMFSIWFFLAGVFQNTRINRSDSHRQHLVYASDSDEGASIPTPDASGRI